MNRSWDTPPIPITPTPADKVVAVDTHAFQVSGHTAYITIKSYTSKIVSVNIVSDKILVVKCGDEVIHEYKFAYNISIFHYRVIDNSTLLIELHTK